MGNDIASRRGQGATSINLDLAPGCRGKKDMDQGFRVESLGCNMSGSKQGLVSGFPNQVSDPYPKL